LWCCLIGRFQYSFIECTVFRCAFVCCSFITLIVFFIATVLIVGEFIKQIITLIKCEFSLCGSGAM
jgi:hypothetical protein